MDPATQNAISATVQATTDEGLPWSNIWAAGATVIAVAEFFWARWESRKARRAEAVASAEEDRRRKIELELQKATFALQQAQHKPRDPAVTITWTTRVDGAGCAVFIDVVGASEAVYDVKVTFEVTQPHVEPSSVPLDTGNSYAVKLAYGQNKRFRYNFAKAYWALPTQGQVGRFVVWTDAKQIAEVAGDNFDKLVAQVDQQMKTVTTHLVTQPRPAFNPFDRPPRW